jgi:hypothetical protein
MPMLTEEAFEHIRKCRWTFISDAVAIAVGLKKTENEKKEGE